MPNADNKLRDSPVVMPDDLAHYICEVFADPDDQNDVIEGIKRHLRFLAERSEHDAAISLVEAEIRFYKNRAGTMRTLRIQRTFVGSLKLALPVATGLAIQWLAAKHGVHL